MEQLLFLTYDRFVRRHFDKSTKVGVVKTRTENGMVIEGPNSERLFIVNADLAHDGLGKAEEDFVAGETVMYRRIGGFAYGFPKATLRIPCNDVWSMKRAAQKKELSVAGYKVGDIVEGKVRKFWPDKCAVSLGTVRAMVWFGFNADDSDTPSIPWRRGQKLSVRITKIDIGHRILMAEDTARPPDPWTKVKGAKRKRKVAGMKIGTKAEGKFVKWCFFDGYQVLMVDVNGILCQLWNSKGRLRADKLTEVETEALALLVPTVEVKKIDRFDTKVWVC